MQCSCGGTLYEIVRIVEDDERHGEKALRTFHRCACCGRELLGERPFLRTSPTKEERSR